MFKIKVNGGININGYEEYCSNGGSGTICIQNNSSKILKINGDNIYTQTPTILSGKHSDYIHTIYLINNAFLSLKLTDSDLLNNYNFTIPNIYLNNSTFEDFAHHTEIINYSILFKENINLANS